MCYCTPEIKTPCCGDKCHEFLGEQAAPCPWHQDVKVSTNKNWVLAAAQEIGEGSEWDGDDVLVEIIARHCPFKTDVAYIITPRCDSCRYWARDTGACTFIKIDAPGRMRGALLLLTTPDFGCVRWAEKPDGKAPPAALPPQGAPPAGPPKP